MTADSAKGLPIPPPVLGDQDACEMARAWVSKGDLYVSLFIGAWGKDFSRCNEIHQWARILADLMISIAESLSNVGDDVDRDKVLDELYVKFIAEIRERWEHRIPGHFSDDRQ